MAWECLKGGSMQSGWGSGETASSRVQGSLQEVGAAAPGTCTVRGRIGGWWDRRQFCRIWGVRVVGGLVGLWVVGEEVGETVLHLD